MRNLGNLVNKGLDSKKRSSPPKPLLRAWDAAFQQWMGRLFYEEVVLHLASVSQLSGGPELSSPRSQKKKKKKRKTGNTVSGSRLQHTLALQST